MEIQKKHYIQTYTLGNEGIKGAFKLENRSIQLQPSLSPSRSYTLIINVPESLSSQTTKFLRASLFGLEKVNEDNKDEVPIEIDSTELQFAINQPSTHTLQVNTASETLGLALEFFDTSEASKIQFRRYDLDTAHLHPDYIPHLTLKMGRKGSRNRHIEPTFTQEPKPDSVPKSLPLEWTKVKAASKNDPSLLGSSLVNLGGNTIPLSPARRTKKTE